jgi:hypothetical protein
MKHVYLIGFRGTGFRSEHYRQEPLLIRAGHVGFSFEGEESRIFGFHPTAEACRAIGDDEAVKEWLKDHNPLDGALHDDTVNFSRINPGAYKSIRRSSAVLPTIGRLTAARREISSAAK